MSVFCPIWAGYNGLWKPIAFVGPVESLNPEPRKSLNSFDKQAISKRQSGKCNFCDTKLSMFPYSNCDADHIIPICIGGKTNVSNMQLLCCPCHRHKTALENKGSSKKISYGFEKGVTYITCSRSSQHIGPLDRVTPLDAISKQSDLSILTYTTIRKSESNRVQEDIEFNGIFDKFKYVPP